MILNSFFNFKRGTRIALLGCATAIIAGGCSPTIDVRGALPEQEVVDTIRPGQTNKQIVQELLGTPSSKALLKQEIWYYIGEKTATYSFFSPSVRERKVVAIHFDPQSRVRQVKQYDLKNGKDVDFIDRTTPTKGKSLGFLQQLLGNIGRFKDPEAGSGGQ